MPALQVLLPDLAGDSDGLVEVLQCLIGVGAQYGSGEYDVAVNHRFGEFAVLADPGASLACEGMNELRRSTRQGDAARQVGERGNEERDPQSALPLRQTRPEFRVSTQP